jgi:membrane protease YdiL (CAAX protease family)
MGKPFLLDDTASEPLAPPAPPAPPGYVELTRDLAVSLILVLPLLVLYQAGLWLMGYRVVNGADLFTRMIYPEWGLKGLVLFNLGVIAAVLVAIIRFEKRGRFRAGLFAPLLLESLVYASVLGAAIVFLLETARILAVPGHGSGVDPSVRAVILSVGAGVNEELVFRLLLIPVLQFVFADFLDWNDRISSVLAVLVSAAAFSGAHHVGAHGEALELASFAYRFVAGVIFALLYRFRSFAVAAYTHAIYDVLVLVPAARGG